MDVEGEEEELRPLLENSVLIFLVRLPKIEEREADSILPSLYPATPFLDVVVGPV